MRVWGWQLERSVKMNWPSGFGFTVAEVLRFTRLAASPISRRSEGIIPTGIDQYRCAQSRKPMDMIFQGWSMRLFQA